MPSLVTRPSKCSNRCISAGLEILISLWFTIILNDRKGIKKSSKRPNQHDDWHARLTEPVIVSNSAENDCQKPNSLTKSSKSFTQSRRKHSSFNSELVTETNDMAGVRPNLSSKEILERAIDLSQIPEEQVLSQTTNWPEESGLAVVIGSKVIPLVTILEMYWISLQKCLN